MKTAVAVAKITVTAALAAAVAIAASCASVPAQITATVPVAVNTAAPAAQADNVSSSVKTNAAAPDPAEDAVTGTVRFEAMSPDAVRQPAAPKAKAAPEVADDAEDTADIGGDEADSAVTGDAEAAAFDLTDGVWLEYFVDGLCFNAYRFDADGTYTAEAYAFARDLNEAPERTPEYDRTGAYTVDDDGTVDVDGAKWTYLEDMDRFSHCWTFYYFNLPSGPDAVLKEDYIFHHPDIPATSAQAAQEGVENRNHV